MISSRRNNLEKINLEQKVDQFMEVGRQFVDGVSGARPGTRRNSNIKGSSRRNVKQVTRWVNKKMDSFFEGFDQAEDDDWYYQVEDESNDQMNSFRSDESLNNFKKRPLTAISLREKDSSIKIKPKQLPAYNEDWPESSDFQVNRWKRKSLESEPVSFKLDEEINTYPKGRNLPKSSRRRV